ncbi:ribokinase [Jannaschia sp. CCS1]|uniref:ribokinase n=1 Tax=Jannaschia sp. (strain CCS1) TaxID=290400 RepID=UPI000053B9C4|nr:ribokinase [Jannaschia sp. CCS1]ABD56007.1 PfkB [Jannaschia sp. CCS1]
MTYICVVGSINVDLTCYLPRWPDRGETISALRTQTGLGGKGANQAVAARRLGANVHLIGAIGADPFGADCALALRQADITPHLMEATKTATGMALIDVGPSGDNIIRLAHGANYDLDLAFLDQHRAVIEGCAVLLLQNEIPVEISIAAAQLAKAAGALVIMDPAPAPSAPWGPDVLHHFDVITPNTHEAGLLLGSTPRTLADARVAAANLATMGPTGAIVTMGGDGVAWHVGADSGQMLPPETAVIDTVGAGDCFNGALAAYLAKTQTISVAITAACAAASLSTRRAGAAASLPTLQEVQNLLDGLAVA